MEKVGQPANVEIDDYSAELANFIGQTHKQLSIHTRIYFSQGGFVCFLRRFILVARWF
jgi:hypothetical protein